MKSRGLSASALWTASSARAGWLPARRIAAIRIHKPRSSGCSAAACSRSDAAPLKSRAAIF